jgi:hypothetical protein
VETSKASAHVFVSHASPDRHVAEVICETLERHALQCWIAFRDAVPGDRYADAIVGAINTARVLVLVLSGHAVASPHVSREVERGCSKGRKIIAVRIDGAPLTLALEYFLSETHWLDVRRSGIDQSLPALVEAVRRHIELADATDMDSNRETSMDGAVDGARSILVALWACLDPSLQDAFSLAYNKKCREGSLRISTKDFFQALRRIDDEAISQLLGALPEAALPQPAPRDTGRGRSVLTDKVLLSDCVSESLYRFGSMTSVSRKLSPADMFVDIAKRGHGPSVERLRAHGVGSVEIDAAVERLQLAVVEP